MDDKSTLKLVLKEAEEKAKEEFKKKKVLEVQSLLLSLLEKQENLKKKKARLAEEERILKLDFEDIREGNFEKVKERHEKSEVARQASVNIPETLLTTTRNLNRTVNAFGNSTTYSGGWGVDSMYYNSTGSTANGSQCFTLTATSDGWKTLTAGTYKVGDKIFYF